MNRVVTLSQVQKERFSEILNLKKGEIDTLEKYMTFYMLILEVAFECQIISKTEKDVINQTILVSISKSTDGKAILISNNLYVLSYWLLSLKPEEALDELLRIGNNLAQVTVVCEKANRHLNFYINQMKTILTLCKKNVIRLQNINISDTYNMTVQCINDLEKYSYDENLNLKSCHASTIPSIYTPTKIISGFSNYFEKLQDFIESYAYEVSIMCKLNGKYFLKFISDQNEVIQNKKEKMAGKIEKKYSLKLERLKKSYNKLLSKDEELDQIDVDQWYEAEKRRIMEAWSDEEMKLDTNTEDLLEVGVEAEFSIVRLLKEFSIFGKSKKGKLSYPKTKMQKEKILDKITISEAVEEVISFKDVLGLTESEVRYLKSIM